MKRKKENVILEKILVEDYAAEGKSLARVNGKVIFVENVVPGDVIDIRLLRNKKDWAEGVSVQTHSFSKDRVDPFCSHFGICGGCQWQMLPYEKQLLYKQKQVEETLKRIGKIELPLLSPIIGAAETKYYRNKIEYTFGTKEFLPREMFQLTPNSDETPKAVAGFHAKSFFDKIVDIKTCYLQGEPTNAIRLAVKEFAQRSSWPFYDIRNHKGFLRTMQVRICLTGEVMVNIVVGEDDTEKIKQLMDYVLQKFPSLTTLLYTVNTKWNDSLTDLEPIVHHGKGYVIEKMTTDEGENFQFRIGPKSFFQTNTRQAERLYRVTKDFAELTGNEVIYDLYCGAGSIGIFVSQKAKRIIGVDVTGAAIEDAKQNATINSLSKAEFFTGDVIHICNDEFFNEHGKPDVVICDPPRAGMHEKLVKKIIDVEAPILVYVSCNPATQARDLNLLDEKYRVTKIQPVDMFPHTHHIENVAQLKLKKN